MVERGKGRQSQQQQQQQQQQALGRPPMPGLLYEMKQQRTMNPRLLTEQEFSTIPDKEWHNRSHSSERIDVRAGRDKFQQVKRDLESNLQFKVRQ